jgi:phosphoglycolate phosphatase
MYRLIVFDLDGTLLDSLADLCVAINRLAAEHGGRPLSSQEVARMVGEGAGVLVSRAIEASGARVAVAEALPRYLEIYDSLLPGQTRPYPGIPEVLAAAAPARQLAVLTNKPTEASRKILDAFGLSARFLAIVGGDGPYRRKPHPDGLAHIMSIAAVKPADTLLVGDSSVDVQTAHNAGARVCVARYGFGQASFQVSALRGDEIFVDRPEELTAVIDD